MATAKIHDEPEETSDGEGRLLLSVSEAGHRLHVSRPVLYDLIRSGKLRSLRVGRVHRIPVWALDEFIAAEICGAPHEAS